MRLIDLFENKKDFNSWFSGSKIVNQDGSPRVMYHGANSRFKNFARDHNGLIFFTTEMDFAQGHIRNGGADSNIKSAYISSKNPWNFRNPRDIKNLINKLESDGILTSDTYDSFFDSDDPRDIDLEEIYEWFESGDWMIIESGRRVIPTIRSLGYDGIWMVEDGVLNLAVFSNNQIWPLSDEEQLSEATVSQLAPQYNLWTAPVRIKQPNYTGYIDVTVTAPDMRRARTLIKSMYGVQEWQIGATKQVKPKKMTFIHVTVDVHCSRNNERYRAFINGELFTERTWLWEDKKIEETFQIEADAGEYILEYKLIGNTDATITTSNPRITLGNAVINDSLITIF